MNYAATENDAAFLQGYAQARDRFFQMDFSRRGASGTVAELVGSAGLANDVQLRALGLRRAAYATYQQLSSETKGWLSAYANGVNFWLAGGLVAMNGWNKPAASVVVPALATTRRQLVPDAAFPSAPSAILETP